MDIGKYKGRKDETRLQQTVNEMKGQFVSLRKACAKNNLLMDKILSLYSPSKANKVKVSICK